MKKILLILVLVVSLFGSDAEEIGIPYVEEGKGKIQSAVLDPDGKHFYTLKDEIVTKWLLEPIKKISAFKPGIEPKIWHNGYHLSVTSDSKKMILRSIENIFLWDLEKNKLIKKVKQKTYDGVMDGSEFVTIDRDRNLIRWDTNTLHINKSDFLMPYSPNGFGPYLFMINNDVLLTISHNKVALCDKNTLNVLDTVGVYSDSCYSTVNKKIIYCHADSIINGIIVANGRKINLNTGSIEIVTKKWIDENMNIFGRERGEYKGKKQHIKLKDNYITSSSDSLYLVYMPGTIRKVQRIFQYLFYDDKTKQRIAAFYQFKDDAWILINPDGYFEASSKKVKKYLKMKTKSKKRVPINNATFKKYNKQIKLKG